MKRSIYTLLFGFFPLVLMAQLPFSITPNPAHIDTLPNVADAPCDAIIHNNTNQPLNIKWERIIINLPTGMRSQVCDPVTCYFATVSTKSFTLPGGAEGDMIVHFLNDVAQPFQAIIHLKVYNIDDPTQEIIAVYTYNSIASDAKEPLPAAVVKMYPNPSTEFLALENAADVHFLRVYSLEGRQVAQFNASDDHRYDISQLAPGAYVLSLEDEKGRLFQAVEFVKQ